MESQEKSSNENPNSSFSIKPISELQSRLGELFIGREREIDAILASLISGEPSILIGPPGTAKTTIIESMAKLVNAKYFYYLLTKFTEPDELLGPIDIIALREGKYVRRMEHRLPTVDIAFLDEIFKASSAIRNTLLDIILNRRVINGTEYIKLPLLTLYTASNEISTDEEDQAFYDRLLIRVFVDYIAPADWEMLLIRGVQLSTADLKPIIDVEYVRRAQEVCRLRAMEIVASDELRRFYLEVLSDLKYNKIELSDRRKVKAISVAAALSIVYGEKTPSRESIVEAIRLVAPHAKEDVAKINEVLAKYDVFASELQAVLTIIDEMRKMVNNKRIENMTLTELSELKTLHSEAVKRVEKLLDNKRYRKRLKELGVIDYLNNVADKLMQVAKRFNL